MRGPSVRMTRTSVAGTRDTAPNQHVGLGRFRSLRRSALRSDRPKRRTVALRASVSSDRRAQALVPIRPVRALGRESANQQSPASHGSHLEAYNVTHSDRSSGTEESPACPSVVANDLTPPGRIPGGGGSGGDNAACSPSASSAGARTDGLDLAASPSLDSLVVHFDNDPCHSLTERPVVPAFGKPEASGIAVPDTTPAIRDNPLTA
jgi:hypothetical protein